MDLELSLVFVFEVNLLVNDICCTGFHNFVILHQCCVGPRIQKNRITALSSMFEVQPCFLYPLLRYQSRVIRSINAKYLLDNFHMQIAFLCGSTINMGMSSHVIKAKALPKRKSTIIVMRLFLYWEHSVIDILIEGINISVLLKTEVSFIFVVSCNNLLKCC